MKSVFDDHAIDILEHMSEGFVALDKEGRFVYVNKQAEVIFHPRNKIIGKLLHDLFPDVTQSADFYRLAEAAKSGNASTFETFFEGNKTWYEVHLNPGKEYFGIYFRDISERKRSEIQLRNSDDRYRAFIGKSSEGIWRFEIDTPIDTSLPVAKQVELAFDHAYLAECNDALARMYGYAKAEELIGARLHQFMLRDDPRNVAYLTEFITTGYNLTGAMSKEHDKNGNTKWFENSLVGIVEKGYLVRAWGTQSDITARIDIEHDRDRLVTELTRANGLLDSIVEQAPIGIGFWDRDLRYVRVNKALADINGFSPEEHRGKTINELLPHMANRVTQSLKHVIDTDQVATLEVSGETPAAPGVTRWWYVVFYPIRLTEGPKNARTLIGAGAICEEITVRKKAEEDRFFLMNQLVQSEQNFRMLTEAIPQIIWTNDAKGTFTFFNSQWYDYTGLSPEESLVGNEFQNVIHPDDMPVFKAEWKKALKTGRQYQMEVRLKGGADGTYRWFLARALPLLNQKKTIIKWFGTCTDIDSQKRLDERKDEFIGVASHELKTPLTSIKAYSQLLERIIVETNDKRAKDYFDKTNKYIDHLNRLITDLLDVSKIQSGKMQFDLAPIDFQIIVDDSVEAARLLSIRHKIILQGSVRVTVLGDKHRLEQVFINLLSNAVKYSPQATEIIVKVRQEKGRVVAEVIDFGIGIAEKTKDRIFERFYRVEDVAKKFSGLGIGLFISHEIIRRHGGTIQVVGNSGKGTTFRFSLPIVKRKKSSHSAASKV